MDNRDTVIAQSADAEWRDSSPPDYSRTNSFLKSGSKYNHLEGSLEAIVQNLVRTFEMEASFKTNPQQWVSVVAEKFRMSTNGGPAYTVQDIVNVGTYNLFLTETEHYNPKEEDFESSYSLFVNALPQGFVWEVIEVFSGPPNVTFKWRHWGNFTGKYKEYEPTGETIEIVGMSVARVSEDLKIESVEHFFDTNAFLEKLTAGKKLATGEKLETGCPFHSPNSASLS
ncbi:SnoaL-like polyketide cyclase [Microseira wollei]|uniref:Pathogenesis related protein-like protein n=1 Tax=Microseira wollei NIES-4236 TaxID=2530354 RepID=A0AAV3X885_9CYAN|nr:SnoaL-like polyketide cyclase [Microseira wollei]GET36885.1 pathogenesis related protein-like protein [Microseira wollei NIES-4236]